MDYAQSAAQITESKMVDVLSLLQIGAAIVQMATLLVKMENAIRRYLDALNTGQTEDAIYVYSLTL